jgi:hypothetical protein
MKVHSGSHNWTERRHTMYTTVVAPVSGSHRGYYAREEGMDKEQQGGVVGARASI